MRFFVIGKIFVGFDLETGQEFDSKDRKFLTELGAVKYVFDGSVFKPISIFSAIVNEGFGVSPEAVEYTGITPRLVKEFGQDPKNVLESFNNFLEDADFVVSHNGDQFDVPVMADAYEYHGIPNLLKQITNIDTMICIKYPNNCKSRNLTYLQAFHGFVNPFPHRAFSDVMAMMKVMENYHIEEIAEIAKSPTVSFYAKFDYPKEKKFATPAAYKNAMENFNKTKDTVKSLGFRWNAESKQWIYEGKELIFNRDIRPNLICPVHQL